MGTGFNAIKCIDYGLLSAGATTAVGLDSADAALNVTTGQVGGVEVRRAFFSIEIKAVDGELMVLSNNYRGTRNG